MSRMSRKSRSSSYLPFRSKLEVNMATELVDNNIKFGYEVDKLPYYTAVRGGKCAACGSDKGILKKRYYVPDFTVGALILETKGRLTSAERTKFIALNEAYPNRIVLVFQRNNPLKRGGGKLYLDWAKEHGIKAVVGVALPLSLTDELLEESVKQKQSPPAKLVATYKTKASGPTMAGTKVESKRPLAKGKTSGKTKKA